MACSRRRSSIFIALASGSNSSSRWCRSGITESCGFPTWSKTQFNCVWICASTVVTSDICIEHPSLGAQEVFSCNISIICAFIFGVKNLACKFLVTTRVPAFFLDRRGNVWYSMFAFEGVAGVLARSKSTYWPFGLACFHLRDSCAAYLPCMEFDDSSSSGMAQAVSEFFYCLPQEKERKRKRWNGTLYFS